MLNRKKEYMHNFLNFWVEFKSKDFLESEWYEMLCCDWCEYFGYNDPDPIVENILIEFSVYSIKNFPNVVLKNKPKSFFNEDWDNFLKIYDAYFDVFLYPDKFK
jgi:hypothetical protein